jgi:enediyne biosynthesis protein E4
MKTNADLFRRHAAPVFAVAVVSGLYFLAQLPTLSDDERQALAGRFHFIATALPRVPGPPVRSMRPVHPSLAGIAAWISSVGAAAALADIDGDGLPNDACYVDTRTNQVIVAPVPDSGARYAPFALDFSGLRYDETMAPMGCLPGNFKEDERTDLLVYFWGRTPVAFLHQTDAGPLGARSFVAEEIVPGGERWYSNSATLADIDGDGHFDLIIGNYFPDGARILDAKADGTEAMQHSMSYALNGAGPRLLLWTGATRSDNPSVGYRDVSDTIPPEARHGWTLAVAAADLDGDQLPEIYVANDFGPDRLLANRSRPGHPEFALVRGKRDFVTPKSKTLGYDSFKGMGVDFGDIDGRGRLDIFVSNITEPYALEESNFAFMNTGDPAAMKRGVAPFVDKSEQLGLARSGWAWDAKLADFDNSGELQAQQATGFVHGKVNRWPELQELAMANDQAVHAPGAWLRVKAEDDLSGGDRNPFFVRSKSGVYFNIADDLGLEPTDKPHPSRGIAIADSFGDGKLDFAVANQWGDTIFYRNAAPGRHRFLGLYLRLPIEKREGIAVSAGQPPGAPPSRPAIGATATVRLPDGRVRIAQVDGGNGHSGKRSPDLHFGLGDVPETQTVEVDLQWRDSGGAVGRQRVTLTPGWHTVILGTLQGLVDD